MVSVPRGAHSPRKTLQPPPHAAGPVASRIYNAPVSGAPSSLRILLTNTALHNRAGSELYVHDLALELRRRGHEPVVYSPRVGEVGRAIRRAGVPVVDDLAAIDAPPDLVHGQHHLETMAALARFPGVPAIYVCHGRLPWEEVPPVHPRIVRYVAVSRIVHEHVASVEGIDGGRVRLVGNFVDTARFRPRGPLPAAPRRALLFDNHASEEGYVPAIREACAREGIAFDVVGLYSGNATSEPERILGGYDVVFARGRAALESLAVGAAVIVCGVEGAGPMVRRGNLDQLLGDNFGIRAMRGTISESWAREALRAYDAADATAVAAAVRSTRSLEAVAGELVALYREALAEWHAAPRGDAARDEALASARYGRWLSLSVGERLQQAADVAAERDELARQAAHLRGELAQLRGSLTFRLYDRVTRSRALRKAYRIIARPFKRNGAQPVTEEIVSQRLAPPSLPVRRPLEPGAPELACVVMSVGAPASLPSAVRSLLAQSEPVELVVVNSGGGGAAELLRRAGIEGVNVIERGELLWPGAARNEGILATRAPWVAFLAADCVAEPGWVAGRLARHRAGALAVSSAVTNLAADNPPAWAAHVALFSRRMPGLAASEAAHYGVSYDRRLFDRFGLFRADLRTGEDTELNGRLRGVELAWAPEVRSAHRHPVTARGLLGDQRERGRRMAAGLHRLTGRRAGLRVARNAIVRLPSSLRTAWRGSLPGERRRVAAAAPLLLPAAASYAFGALGATGPETEIVPPRRTHRILALLAARNEETNLPQWLANVAPQVDGIVALDDGSSDATAAILASHPSVLELISIPAREPHVWDEPRNRRLLVEAALRHGAEWMIVVDADERLERGFRERAEAEIERAGREGHLAYRVTMRELWSDPARYRVDGVWGAKRPPRFFRARADHEFDERPFHGWWAPLNSMPGGDCAAADIVVYHLRMIRPEDRLARRRRYEDLDPDNAFQEIGYGYLTDETGLELEPIPDGRHYEPMD